MLAKLSRTVLAVVSLVGSAAYANFLPPNNLHLQDNRRAAANVTEAQFNAVIDEAVAYYGPFIKSNFNANFTVSRRWTDSTVNASATQFFGSWAVNMYGGLARRPEMTPDGFALVLCHEIGHHLGGYPFASAWASDEGESDYFATQSCARDLWKAQTEKNALSRDVITAYPKALCDGAWDDTDDQNLCYRTVLASKAAANLLAALGGTKAAYETTDKSVVKATYHSHPAGQCRLDTYVAAALCTQTFDASAIPGKDLGSKRNSAAAEESSGRFTCLKQDFTVGTRPLCWFKPLL